ncbi:MAG TPA: radical SAM protein [Gemmatimonadaceae bacterium]|jgi:MoaA/NifB/PqqE/SkfB family radical SAM enzyme|nr:radical SAM protein [Gemmatimonadaceae bacterium]
MTVILAPSTEQDIGPPLNVPSIDVFVTFRCGLRCSHCFVGDNLDSFHNMSFVSLENLLRTAHSWQTRQVTFLGGEPTMYPRFSDALRLAWAEGYQARVVTNGHLSYRRFLRTNTDSAAQPVVCFSIDGSTARVHDAIRGAGSFSVLLDSIARTIAAGYRISAIVAVCRENYRDVEGILQMCRRFACEYVNIHYVTNRGFAKATSVLSIDEWRDVCDVIKEAASAGRPELRVERTFLDDPPEHFTCAVTSRSNLMFLPDGRVYMCMMFIDVPNAHSFVWDGESLRPNLAATSERAFVHRQTLSGCPAMALVNAEIAAQAASRGKFIQCMYDKESVLAGSDRIGS